MTYGIRETPSGVEVEVEAAGRQALCREALTALSALSFGDERPLFEKAVPIQTAGDDDEELLRGLVSEFLREAAAAEGVLGPPRWVLFEPGRASAMLPFAPGVGKGRPLALREARVAPGSAKAALVLGSPL